MVIIMMIIIMMMMMMMVMMMTDLCGGRVTLFLHDDKVSESLCLVFSIYLCPLTNMQHNILYNIGTRGRIVF